MTQSFNLLKILTEPKILLQTCFIMPAISSFNIACNRVSGNLEHSCISIQSLKTGSFLQGKYLKISHNKVNKNNLKLPKISAGTYTGLYYQKLFVGLLKILTSVMFPARPCSKEN